MARLKFEPNRSIDTLPEHVGKVLLFCEGETEKNYFEYFKDVFLHEEFKYSDIDECWQYAMEHSDTQLKTAARPAKSSK